MIMAFQLVDLTDQVVSSWTSPTLLYMRCTFLYISVLRNTYRSWVSFRFKATPWVDISAWVTHSPRLAGFLVTSYFHPASRRYISWFRVGLEHHWQQCPEASCPSPFHSESFLWQCKQIVFPASEKHSLKGEIRYSVWQFLKFPSIVLDSVDARPVIRQTEHGCRGTVWQRSLSSWQTGRREDGMPLVTHFLQLSPIS